jgi:hypothetical protein
VVGVIYIVRGISVVVPGCMLGMPTHNIPGNKKKGTYAGGSIPKAALAPHPSRLKPVLTIIYGFASLKSPPGIGDLPSALIPFNESGKLTHPAQSSELY